MSLLTICQGAAIALSITPPTIVMTAVSRDAKLLLRCASAEGKYLASRHNWQALLSEATFTTLATPAQAIATDFDRMIPETMFNRTTNRRFDGPLDSGEWQAIQSTLVTFVNPAFRIRGNSFYITPTPPAGQSVAYEYISRNWCQSASLVAQSDWAADADTAKLNEEAMIQGVVWRFKQSKGLAWNDDFLMYERYVGDLLIRDGSRPRIYTDQTATGRNPTPPWIPETLVFS